MLKWIKRLLLLIILIAAFIIGVTFSSQNSAPISLVIFSFHLPELNVGLWVAIAMFVGAIIGLLISFLPLFFSRHTNTYKDKKIIQLEKELNKLRVSSLKG